MKIKLQGGDTPSGSPGHDGQEAGGSGVPSIPKITIKLGGTVNKVGSDE